MFLRLLLEEIILFGDFMTLQSHVVSHLEASNPIQLFIKMIERLEATYDEGRGTVGGSVLRNINSHTALH